MTPQPIAVASTDPAEGRPGGRAGWHRRTTLLPLAYLAAVAAVGLAHPLLAQWWWLGIHLLLLGAVSNAIVIWSAHFTTAVLRAPAPTGRRGEVLRLALLNVGVVGVLAGGATDRPWPGLVGAGLLPFPVIISEATDRRFAVRSWRCCTRWSSHYRWRPGACTP